ncbi:HU family DNA-binding protein [Granulicella arctica]|uniref:HU family DNA-binding protein n=1 Tax=Granulicella arctica TaxID=940613 RepID=UPI00295BFA59|nr:HU family DNA-binding protein [Granulicella arctica]
MSTNIRTRRFCKSSSSGQQPQRRDKKEREFTIPGLGKLVRAQHAARLGRNLQTGESIKTKAKTTVKSASRRQPRMLK